MKTILKLFKKQYLRILLNLLITILFLSHVMHFHFPILTHLENIAYDYRVVLTMPNTVYERIVIIDIDEKSLAEIGRWPWSRDIMAKLTNQLFDEYGVDLVGFDIVFPEEDKSSGLYVLNQLAAGELSEHKGFIDRVKKLQKVLDYDQLFVDSLANRRIVLGYYFKKSADAKGKLISGKLPQPLYTKDDLDGIILNTSVATGYGANIAKFQLDSTPAGHFTPQTDEDGIIRSVPILYEYKGGYYEALSLAMVRVLNNVDELVPIMHKYRKTGSGSHEIESLQVGDLTIPVDKLIHALVPYRGNEGSFKYVSASDVLKGRIDKAALKNRIILVGTTTPALYDLSATPVAKVYPGVEIHANLIAGILDGTIKQKPKYIFAVELLQILLIGILLSLIIPCISPLVANLIFGVFLALIMSLNYLVWEAGNTVVSIAPLLLMLLIMYLFNMAFGFFIEQRSKRQISGLFGQYIPPELVDELSENPAVATMEAENRVMTVLFSDVRGFTTISEGLDPAELSKLINAILTPLTGVIHDNRGTIDKYMGDAIMAFWGAPLEDKDHARHAMRAGYDMIEGLHALKHEFKERGWPEIKIGVGINTGEMSVGNMGSEFRIAYTVLGDTVNLGSRLEGLTKNYGVDIIVSESTKELVPDYLFMKLDKVRVKGKNKPVTIYHPVTRVEEISPEEEYELDEYGKALKHYYRQEWGIAKSKFILLQQSYSRKKIYDIYLERIENYINTSPSESWDGVYTHTTK